VSLSTSHCHSNLAPTTNIDVRSVDTLQSHALSATRFRTCWLWRSSMACTQRFKLSACFNSHKGMSLGIQTPWLGLGHGGGRLGSIENMRSTIDWDVPHAVAA
jgi:hypothetical protein